MNTADLANPPKPRNLNLQRIALYVLHLAEEFFPCRSQGSALPLVSGQSKILVLGEDNNCPNYFQSQIGEIDWKKVSTGGGSPTIRQKMLGRPPCPFFLFFFPLFFFFSSSRVDMLWSVLGSHRPHGWGRAARCISPGRRREGAR